MAIEAKTYICIGGAYAALGIAKFNIDPIMGSLAIILGMLYIEAGAEIYLKSRPEN